MPLFKFTHYNKYGMLRSRIFFNESSQVTIKPGFGPFVGISPFKYESQSRYYGLLTSSVDGKKYLTPDWIEVLPETTIDDIKYIEPEEPKEKPKVWEFKSSSSDDMYKVKQLPDGRLTCDCWGFRAHKRCKHVKEVAEGRGA